MDIRNDFVQLRVGGKLFETSMDVLLSEPDSIFVAMLRSDWSLHPISKKRKPLVLDRDPKRFRVVLNWLRTRELVCEDGVTPEGVRSEAEFFQLCSLAEEASRVVQEREGHCLLQAALDSRRGKLVSLGPGEAASLPTGEAVLVHGPCVVAVQASFEAVDAGIMGEVVVDGSAAPEFVVHTHDGGRMLRAIGKVSDGPHHLQLLFRHFGIHDPYQLGYQPRAYVFGPARVEFWRYPSAAIVWMDEQAALKNTAAWYAHNRLGPMQGGIQVDRQSYSSGGDIGVSPHELTSPEELQVIVGALSSCVYR